MSDTAPQKTDSAQHYNGSLEFALNAPAGSELIGYHPDQPTKLRITKADGSQIIVGVYIAFEIWDSTLEADPRDATANEISKLGIELEYLGPTQLEPVQPLQAVTALPLPELTSPDSAPRTTHLLAVAVESSQSLEYTLTRVKQAIDHARGFDEYARVVRFEDALPEDERGGLLLRGEDSGKIVYAGDLRIGSSRLLLEYAPDNYPSVGVTLNHDSHFDFGKRMAEHHGGLEIIRDGYGVTEQLELLEHAE